PGQPSAAATAGPARADCPSPRHRHQPGACHRPERSFSEPFQSADSRSGYRGSLAWMKTAHSTRQVSSPRRDAVPGAGCPARAEVNAVTWRADGKAIMTCGILSFGIAVGLAKRAFERMR